MSRGHILFQLTLNIHQGFMSSPRDSHGEALIPGVAKFGDGPSKEVITVNEIIMMRP